MKLFEGMGKTDYQDVLRAIGRLIDEYGYRDIRLIETGDGLILQGCQRSTSSDPAGSGGYVTTFFTDQDVQTILAESYRLRRAPSEKMQVASQTASLLRKIKSKDV
jgi:hypothetical protein